MNFLSSLHREQALQKISSESFDLVVIGGGITGAGIALDAASRGMKIALIEKDDFAAGTSSKSTKLIHGGLRYLKQFEIALVREVGRERATVHRLAPHLVLPEKMLLPLIEGGTFGAFATSIGLRVYDLLAGVKGEDKRRMLGRDETIRKEPLLRKDILKGGGFYAEYRTDDARLTIENIKTAVGHGAVCLNYVSAEDLHYDDQGRVNAVHCRDRDSGENFDISSRFVISAAGPWVDKLRKKDNSLKGKHLFLSKGVHIVVAHERFPINHAVYFDVPDGRMIFAIPRLRSTYIGTTDTPYEGSLDDVPVRQEDVDYLLEAVNGMFPEVNLTTQDVESSWAGLRPLIHEEGKSASEMSRKDEIFVSDTGLISIAGGKLTGYRKMAERVVDFVAEKYQLQQNSKKLKANWTGQIPLTGGPFNSIREVSVYRAQLEKHILSLPLPAHFAGYLVSNYGKQSDAILSKMKDFQDPPVVALARAEVWFTVENELVLTPLDYFNRRSGRLYFDLPGIAPVLTPVLLDFQTYFGWDDEKLRSEREKVEIAMHQASEFEYSPREEAAAG